MTAGAANSLLARAGRNGPALLCGGVLAGLAAPALAEAARPLMGVAVFILTLGALLKVDGPACRTELADRGAALAVTVWATFGVPLLAFCLVTAIRPGPDIALGLVLCALAPPVGSAAALAAMLGLGAPLALVATLAATLAAPFYLPPLATLLAGADLALDPVAMALRLGAMVGAATVAAWMLRRHAGRWVAGNPNAMTGIAVVGLLLLAVGTMRGMGEAIAAAPGRAALLLGLAVMVNATFQVAGALVFAALGCRRALTVGLVSGNRNVALVWAAASSGLADRPAVEMLLAMSIVAVFALPMAMQRPVASLLERLPDGRPVPHRIGRS